MKSLKNIILTVIGGVGYGILSEEGAKVNEVKTSYGNVSVSVIPVTEKMNIAFISRHLGKNHVPPHKVNFPALIDAARQIGAPVLSVNSVGLMREIPLVKNLNQNKSSRNGLNQNESERNESERNESERNELNQTDLKRNGLEHKTIITSGNYLSFPFFVPNDFIDMTKNRNGTFYDNETVHTDMTDPYCSDIRRLIYSVLEEKNLSYSEGVYLCTEGPRFETKAEIRMYAHFADVVGMTGVPEVVLAKEAGLCYASLCVITNPAAGLSQNMITANEVKVSVEKTQKSVIEIISSMAFKLEKELSENRKAECFCKNATVQGKL